MIALEEIEFNDPRRDNLCESHTNGARAIIKSSAQMVVLCKNGMLDAVKAKLRFHFHYKLTIGCLRVG